MTKLSKFVHNSNNWSSVSKAAQTGINVNIIDSKESYFFGLEEWNNSTILRKHNLAYLDSFRYTARQTPIERIELINFNNGNLNHIGRFEKVERIRCKEIPSIREVLTNENWLRNIEFDFHNIGDTRLIEDHLEYMNSWNSDEIIALTNNSFVVNIRYEKFILFDDPINLTITNQNVNNKWKRLIHLYDIKHEDIHLFAHL